MLLGLVTPAKANEMTMKNDVIMVGTWLEFLNESAPAGIVYSARTLPLTTAALTDIGKGLFSESGTIILSGETGHAGGHYYVLARDDQSRFVLLDAQQGLCLANIIDVQKFMQFIHPGVKEGGGDFIVFTVSQPRTPGQSTSDFVNGPLQKQLAASLKFGGSGRRPSSLPTRRAGRSSRKRRYSRRRRALWTGRHRN